MVSMYLLFYKLWLFYYVLFWIDILVVFTSFYIYFSRVFYYFIALIVPLILVYINFLSSPYFGIDYFVSLTFYSGFYYITTGAGFSTI